MAKTKNLASMLQQRLAADPKLREGVERELFNAKVAMLICKARKDSGLTQKELAEAIGSHQSVIARLEDADYDGHSLTILSKIARALGKRLKLGFESIEAHDQRKPRVRRSSVLQWSRKPQPDRSSSPAAATVGTRKKQVKR